jgi:hypothetical protein
MAAPREGFDRLSPNGGAMAGLTYFAKAANVLRNFATLGAATAMQ